MIMPIVRASETGPRQIMMTGMVKPMDMWRFRSSVCAGQPLAETFQGSSDFS